MRKFVFLVCMGAGSLLHAQGSVPALKQSSDAGQHMLDRTRAQARGGDTLDARPRFPSGEEALQAFLAREVHMPEEARAAGVSGNLLVSFMVLENGAIDRVTLLGSLGHGCDEEAIRVLLAMPHWEPAHKAGNPRPAMVTLRIPFGEEG
jgi:TonB family protein